LPNSILANNNSCGHIVMNNYSFLASQIQKSLSPKSVAVPTGMSPGRLPGDPQPQPQPNSFAGVGKTETSPGAKRPRKGSGGTLSLKLQTSGPVNNIDNVRQFIF
jgi:hypothetical protein